MTHTWDLSGRDVVPDLAPAGRPRDPGAAALLGMLNSEGQPWTPPYREVRNATNIRFKSVEPETQDQADSRLRTYFALFRGLGLIYENQSRLNVTPLGHSLRSLLEEQYTATDDVGREVAVANRWRLARMIAPALARYQLATPFAQQDYPIDTDIHPLWAIWRSMRNLDNRLHWDELDRTLTACLRDDQVDDAIERIRLARASEEYDPRNSALLDQLLGPRRPDVGPAQPDRLDVWLSRAGFKGLLLEPRDRTDGYRYLNEEFYSLIDEYVAEPPPNFPGGDRSTYVNWLGQVQALSDAVPGVTTSSTVARVVERCRRHGKDRIIALSGPAGTGKTTIAREAALVLTENDPARILGLQFHAATTYEEFIGGLAPSADGGFAAKSGTLLQFNDQAMGASGLVHVLIIDEVSRADVANVLGELLTYVEYRDRSFYLPALEREVRLAPNLVILATLNPQDRSVVNMDDALVRRLRQIPILSDSNALRSILDEAGMHPALRDEVVSWFAGLPADVPFGHGLFVGVADESDLHDLWHEQLQFFLRRGGITVYPAPEAISQGFRWRHGSAAAKEVAPGVWQVRDQPAADLTASS